MAPVQFVPPPPKPKAVANAELTCPPNDANHCAIDSPLQDLADKTFNTTGSQPATQYVNILDIGEDSLELRIHLIRAARTSIDIQTFIWADDETGKLILKELINAAKRGVKVRIIADQLISVRDAKLGARLAVTHENLQIKLFNPLLGKVAATTGAVVKGFLLNFSLANRRMHNKIMVFDGRIGITGGRNFENKYYDMDPKYNFLDRDLMVIGPVAADMRKSFNEYWADSIAVALDQHSDVSAVLFKNGIQQEIIPVRPHKIELPMFEQQIKRALDADVIRAKFMDTHYPVKDIVFAYDHPRKGFAQEKPIESGASASLRDAVVHADKRLIIQTPYLLLSKHAQKELKRLKKNNPDFQFIISTNSLAATDAFYVYALTMKNRKRYIKKYGMQIHEIKPVPGDVEDFVPRYQSLVAQYNKENAPVDTEETLQYADKQTRVGLHQKSIVIDGEIAVVGSHNFDPRSAVINTEVTLTIRDRDFAQALENRIRRYIEPQNSWVVAQRRKVPILGHFSELLATISRMLPIFDIWPFRYTSVYELREGMTAVSPGHPEFYKRYRNVGQFPKTSGPIKDIQTLLVSGFGGVIEPLM